MRKSEKVLACLLSTALVTTCVPFSVALADQPTGDESQQSVEVAAQQQEETVYDKADFYQEDESEAAVDNAAAPRALLSASTYATTRSSTLSPVYLSDEFKYFTKYESGGNYDQGFSSGDDYHALGAYQFDNRYGLKEFILECYYYDPDTFSMFGQFESVSDYDFEKSDAIRSNGQFTDLGNALNAAWHAAYKANPALFTALQDGWAYERYYLPAENYLAGRGIYIANRADCVRGLCWGLANLFGLSGWRKFVGGYSSGYNWDGVYVSQDWPGCGLRDDMSDVEFVTTLCTYVVDNVAVFYAGQPQYHTGWQNRYRNELDDCLNMLGTWEQVDGRWKYKQRDGYATNCWLKIKSVWYWFDAEGFAAQSTMKSINGSTYYFDEDCAMVVYNWVKVDGSWYFFGATGAAHSGWLSWGSHWYWMDENGKMATGWVKDGAWYFFNGDGVMQTGWVDDEGARYFLDSSGALTTGWQLFDGSWYWLDRESGKMVTGWLSEGGSWYYLQPSGAMATGWVKDGSAWYYLDSKGKMATGWVKSNGCWYYLAESGAMATGWLKDGGTWYFLDRASGEMATGWLASGGVQYYFRASGAMATGWEDVSGKWHFFSEDGAMQTGWLKDGGSWYYLQPSGAMATGWVKVGGSWYYLAESGAMATGWLLDGGAWYWLDRETGAMAVNTVIDGYRVGADGKWIP